ncbi:CWF19-like protein 2 homolog [Herrania umbratica]|uniref:CWF19-like protein 2 homolog n=1 Tax=Herrania umbratica TaxID=108875 RepID=A0A6J1AVP5_9ROSI|nr:CWF19-like protein 2 homolog [Herrania umbratica]
MLSGVKFIPRDQIDKEQNEYSDVKKKKSSSKKEKRRRKEKSSRYGGSSSDDDLERIKKGSGRNNKWYSSEEYSSGSGSERSSDRDEKRSWNRRKDKRGKNDSSGDEFNGRSKKGSRRKKQYSSSYSSSEEEDQRGNARDRKKKGQGIDDGRESPSLKDKEIERKEMGLEWMLRPAFKPDKKPSVPVEQPEEPPAEEIKKVNPRELNPYLKDNGTGYPEEADEKSSGADRLLSSSLVGDGGASWRLKALKRAEEQAAREGRRLEVVVQERWGSLDILAEYGASRRAAAPRAHLHAIRNRKQGQDEEKEKAAGNESGRDSKKNTARDYLRDVSLRHSDMRAPKVRDSLSWGKRKSQNTPAKDAGIISAANKFANDGNFMQEFLRKQGTDTSTSGPRANHDGNVDSEVVAAETNKTIEVATMLKETLSTNQLAAKALQLRLKGKHEEAEKLLLEVESMKAKQSTGDHANKQQNVDRGSRYVVNDVSMRKRKDDDDTDKHLARRIMHNKQYSVSGQADDEYDYEDGPSRKSRKKGGRNDQKVSGNNILSRRILTQQERCLFCFENPNRPKHLVVAIANFTYLMLPQCQPVVPGHCCILPMQHESATRTVDNNVWDEIRNFKKCLIMMFAKQDKELVFLETVMGLAQQRCHCLIECIPMPREIAKQAPVYFKKAIDEAEDEWSQHNAKKLIDTSEKGLRGSIPKNFPYFHVEFGLNRGFVHVIDDESQFKSSLGLNVIRGMLQLPEEDMYRRRRHQSVEEQKQAVASFARDWEPFDWTKQLD